MGELLVVVERSRREIYESLRRTCLELDEVQVVLDRRHEERRRFATLADERRRAERRQRRIDPQLASLGFAILRRDPPRHDRRGGLSGVAVEANHHDMAAFLATVPLFREFTPEEMRGIAERMRVRRLRHGQVLFEEGEHGEEMFVVREGRVIISKEVAGRAEEVLALMAPGDFFGEMNLFGGQRRSATARAETDAVLLEVDRQCLEHLVESSPRAGLSFFAGMVRIFSKRLDRTDQLVAEVTRWGLEATGLDADFA